MAQRTFNYGSSGSSSGINSGINNTGGTIQTRTIVNSSDIIWADSITSTDVTIKSGASGNVYIHGVANPTKPEDAANKFYVDDGMNELKAKVEKLERIVKNDPDFAISDLRQRVADFKLK